MRFPFGLRPTTCLLFLCWVLRGGASYAAAPPLRDQLSLNGIWEKGGQVPVYEGVSHFDQQTFERKVTVPKAWKGKRIRVEFGAVNFIADVYVNEQHRTQHIGGWNPFGVDVTDQVQPGAAFTLRVEVKGPKHPPITNAQGGIQWPVGGWVDKGGIAEDVWLRAYGPVAIEDAFVQPSFADKKITITYTVRNATPTAQTVALTSEAVLARDPARKQKLTGETLTLQPGETRTLRLSTPWATPQLWWPDAPALYHLHSKLMQQGKETDRETRRFGFREFTIQGNQFYLNGVRINLFGDYQAFGATWYTSPTNYTPANWPATLRQIQDLNIRVLRWHHNPVPQYILDASDESGLLICDEAANYARDFHKKTDHADYVQNFQTWVKPWMMADRNHPSVYMWNATNEMTFDFAGSFTRPEILTMGAAIRALDGTRPIGYDGEGDVEQLVDYHYPEGYNQEPAGSLYAWRYLGHPQKPTGAGEFLHTKSPLPEAKEPVERNTWWLGIWPRGLRYLNWTNVKPACFWFTQEDLKSDNPARRLRTLNLKNAYAPVALFDKDYDDLGITPFVTDTTPGGTLPAIRQGAAMRRILVLYNDEFSNPQVEAEVELRVAGATYAKARNTFTVPLGEHLEIIATFQVPPAKGQELEMVLRTFKNGQPKFEEVRHFRVEGRYDAQEGSKEIILTSQFTPEPDNHKKYTLPKPKKAE